MIELNIITSYIDNCLIQINKPYTDLPTLMKYLSENISHSTSEEIEASLTNYCKNGLLQQCKRDAEGNWQVYHSQIWVQESITNLIPHITEITNLGDQEGFHESNEKWKDDLAWIGTNPLPPLTLQTLLKYLNNLNESELTMLTSIVNIGKLHPGNVDPGNLFQTIAAYRHVDEYVSAAYKLANERLLFYYLEQGLAKISLAHTYITPKEDYQDNALSTQEVDTYSQPFDKEVSDCNKEDSAINNVNQASENSYVELEDLDNCDKEENQADIAATVTDQIDIILAAPIDDETIPSELSNTVIEDSFDFSGHESVNSDGLEEKSPATEQVLNNPSIKNDDLMLKQVEQVVLECYYKAFFVDRKPEDMLRGFHPIFNIQVMTDNKINMIPLYEFIAQIDQSMSNPTEHWTCELPIIDIVGDAAVVKAELYCSNSLVFTDYLSLYNFQNAGWRIVNRILHKHNPEMGLFSL